jgi:hypothetical protein
MANSKISALTAATTPLAGTEVLPIVQSGVTKQVSVANLTAGRAVSALSLTLTNALVTTSGGTGLSSYTAGDLLYYATGTALSKLGIGASTTILTSSGSAPQWSSASGVSVGTATNLAGGVAGSVPYQSGASATTFLGIGAANTVLTSSGSAPQWSTSLSLAGSVTATAFIPSSSTIPTNGMYLPSSNNLGWATNSSFRMLLGNGGLSINTTTSNAQLTVASSYTSTGVPTAGNSTVWLINDAGSVTADNGPAITFNSRSRTGPTEIQVMAGIKGAKLNANNDEIAGYMSFYTSDNTTRNLVERYRITDLGNMYPVMASSTGMTNGFFYIPGAAGVPSGTPTAISGKVPMYYDTTNNKFYIYNGAWKSVALA